MQYQQQQGYEAPRPFNNPHTYATSPLPRAAPSFLIIGLFALRLTKRLIESLDDYRDRNADLAWLTNFLAPYPDEYALANISGARMHDYVSMYQGIIARMRSQPKYPLRFMQLNPDRGGATRHRSGEGGVNERPREMTDAERLAVIDFCDAAGEWGSTVPIPAHEADRMIELADQRRIADLDAARLR